MSNKNTGGPAFPCDRIPMLNGTAVSSDGMTLRDYFAAKAMQALLTALAAHAVSDDVAVSRSYAIADAMLEAREK